MRSNRASPAPRTQIRLGGAFLLRTSDSIEHRLSVEEPWSTLVPVLTLRHARITAATADRNGVLALHFDDG